MADHESTTTDLIALQFEAHDIRIHIDDRQQPWWEAQDICAILGLKDVSQAIARLRVGEKRTSSARNVLIINESGLYRLIFRSNKPEAQRFQNWVFEEVLPTIRKTGKYEAPALASDKYPELRAMKELIEGIAEARTTAENAERKADLALAQQLWLTIEEYVYLHSLRAQFPPSLWAEFGHYLVGYCHGHGVPIRKQPIAGKPYGTANAYHVEVLHTLLGPWLARRGNQQAIGPVN